MDDDHGAAGPLQKRLERLLLQEEAHWQQRAKRHWLKGGDKNTSFFHQCTRDRKNRNLIDKLVDDEGRIWTASEDINTHISAYFSNLFSTSQPRWEIIDQSLRFVEARVTAEMNRFLDRDFGDDEIRKAIFSINPTKAPGPDGFSSSFFHKTWRFTQDDIYKKVRKILNEGAPLQEWNETTITLIPKVKKAERIKDYRPISLCNVCYKVVAKVIANRWRCVLDKVIDDNQSAFIPGRLITDNILIGFECMHWLRKSKSKEGYAALKTRHEQGIR